MITIVKYSNRKYYNQETHSYMNLQDILGLPIGSYQVIDKETGSDIMVETLFSCLANCGTFYMLDKKLDIMHHLIDELTS